MNQSVTHRLFVSKLFFMSELPVSELNGPDFLGVAAPLPLGTEVLGDQRATEQRTTPNVARWSPTKAGRDRFVIRLTVREPRETALTVSNKSIELSNESVGNSPRFCE